MYWVGLLGTAGCQPVGRVQGGGGAKNRTHTISAMVTTCSANAAAASSGGCDISLFNGTTEYPAKRSTMGQSAIAQCGLAWGEAAKLCKHASCGNNI